MLREARTAAAVHAGAAILAQHLERSLTLAARERAEAEASRSDADAALGAARASVRSLTRDFETLVDAAHRDELARAEQQMRVEALEERAMAELGLESSVLLDEYGPDLPVPVLRAGGR
jgi:chromosome segregation protein